MKNEPRRESRAIVYWVVGLALAAVLLMGCAGAGVVGLVGVALLSFRGGDQVAEEHPSSTGIHRASDPAPPPPPAASLQAQRTKQCWDEIGRIDARLRIVAQEDVVEYWSQNYIAYSQLNLDYVDDELKSIVVEWSAVSLETYSLLSDYQQRRGEIEQGVRDAAEVGAALGSLDEENPEGGAAGGALLFGLFGAAAADEQLKELNAAYEPRYQELSSRSNAIVERYVQLGPAFEARYGLPFEIR